MSDPIIRFAWATNAKGHHNMHRLEEIWHSTGRTPLDPNETLLECEVEIAPGAKIYAIAVRDVILVGDEGRRPYSYSVRQNVRKVDPFIKVEPIENAEHRTVSVERRTGNFGRTEIITQPDTYGDRYDYNRSSGYSNAHIPGTPWAYLPCRVSANGVSVEGDFRFQRPTQGKASLGDQIVNLEAEFFGLTYKWAESWRKNEYDEGWSTFKNILTNFTIEEGTDELWSRFLSQFASRITINKGLKAAESRKGTRENLDRLEAEDPVAWAFYAWLHDDKTKDGSTNNTLLSAFLTAHGGEYETLRSGLREAMEKAPSVDGVHYDYNWRRTNTRGFCLALPGASDKDEERRAKKEWNLRKGAKAQAIGLGIDPDRHPKFLAAIEALQVPLSLFHDPGDALSLVNVEFDLWERCFARGWGEVISRIGSAAARRAKFEKDVTPYLSFLFRIEKYLDRHTGKGKKWKALPKFVESEYELEMSETEEEGTTKRRSALTPIVDNEARTITVPYAAMSIHGVMTTYCYSMHYQVFEENTIDLVSKTPIPNELEIKLNGRDDYGMMYYTLSGTGRNTGYPAFLIIFERRKAGTHVHFHRVHPCRSKDGRETPACRLIEEGYRYMAGNIRAEEIAAQQGDLLFIPASSDIDFTEGQAIREFESHSFSSGDGSSAQLLASEVKSIRNRLGFLKTTGEFRVDHPEHEPVRLSAGVYEIRRCKSYENNPTGVWVLTID